MDGLLAKSILSLQDRYVTAEFPVNSLQEAEELQFRFEGRAGLLGAQKIRIEMANQLKTVVRAEIFEVLRRRFESIRDKSLQNKARSNMLIHFREGHSKVQSVTIYITSDSQVANRLVSYQLRDLFTQGRPVYKRDLVARTHKTELDSLLSRYKGRLVME